MSLPKQYDPASFEHLCTELWKDVSPHEEGSAYTLLLPPPNVTGRLHMGHGFQMTLMDALIRFHHLNGHNVHLQIGTDHAGIATQMVVERQLEKQDKYRKDMSRETFLEHAWAWKEESGGAIIDQMKRLGIFTQWDKECFTLDPNYITAVQEVFITLFDKGLIYRGEKLVNWDPVFKTAISDLEVVNTETQGTLYTLAYHFAHDPSQSIQIATTRPETIFADVAIAIHPDSPNASAWLGKEVLIPLTNRKIPIIADAYVDPEFGTGALKITPAHDFNDQEIGKRHELPNINIFHEDATLNENAPEQYQGLDRFDARTLVIKELQEADALIDMTSHDMMIPIGDRSQSVIEPRLTQQWFMNMDAAAEKGLKLAEEQSIVFFPKNWINTYNHWLEHIEDWCISRQLWWGHRIPAWYDTQGHVYVGKDEQDIREKHQLPDNIQLTQDNDVLDTWFSSSLWAFASMGWPSSNNWESCLPTNVLITGFDIIFFWVARMIMMTEEIHQQIPFKDIYIHGLIRDQYGDKMSKSKGNVIDPIDLIEGIDLSSLIHKRTQGLMQPDQIQSIIEKTKESFPQGIDAYGVDALRFTYCALASTGRDIQFDTQRLIGYRNFCNKLWNAARFIELQEPLSSDKPPEHFINQWILSEIQQCSAQLSEHLKQYRFDLAAKYLYDFLWHTYCDWYIELSKPLLKDNLFSEETRAVLLKSFSEILVMAHPFIPFITETLWRSLNGVSDTESILTQHWPIACTEHSEHQTNIQQLYGLIDQIRKVRAFYEIKPRALLTLHTSQNEATAAWTKQYGYFIKHCAFIDKIVFSESQAKGVKIHAAGFDWYCDIGTEIDIGRTKSRFEQQQIRYQKQFSDLERRLANKDFVKKAPKNVLDKTKEDRDACAIQLTQINDHLEALHAYED